MWIVNTFGVPGLKVAGYGVRGLLAAVGGRALATGCAVGPPRQTSKT